jgi:hypothetical protein
MDDSCTKAVLQRPPGEWGGVVAPPPPVAAGAPDAIPAPPKEGSPSPSSTSGTQRVANSLIKRNAVFAKRNFGGDADNATAVVVYLAYDPPGAGGKAPLSP